VKFRQYHRQDNLRINLAPLIDTVFLLLIFFMMTTTFDRQSQLNISLPEAKGEIVTKPEVVRIIIDARGRYSINDSDHSLIDSKLETLKRALEKEMVGKTTLPLLISADAQAPHQAVMKAMQAARDLGLEQLSFEAQHVPE